MEPVRYETMASEYSRAFKSLRAAKNIFFTILLLAILVQIASFCLVDFLGALDPIYSKAAATSRAATQAVADTEHAVMLRECEIAMHWLLPGTKFAAVVFCLLLMLTLMFSVKVSLVGRLGGVAGFMGAFFWSLILLAMLIPWQQALHSTFACGALYNFEEMIAGIQKIKTSWGAPQMAASEKILSYARFLAYPVLALLVMLAVQSKFKRGYRKVSGATTVEPGKPMVPPMA